jgi:Lhr-like helicase
MSKLYGVLLSSDATVGETMAAILTIITNIINEGCEDDQMKRERMGTVIEALKGGLGLK